MTSLALISHPDCVRHDTGFGHPESADRLRSILDYLPTTSLWSGINRYEAPLVARAQLDRVHQQAYVDAVIAAEPSRGRVHLDPDTSMAPHSLSAAFRAAGALVKAVDLLMCGEATQAFCAVRPPGHHAESGRAMGFCLFNNVAVGARYAQDRYGLSRIAILDFDVHHGNGTEEIFRNDSSVLYCSSFQHPFYPGSGADTQSAHVLNVPLPAGTEGGQFRSAYRERILPALEAFAPQLLLVSAGFDAHRDDPLAQFYLEEADFSWVTAEIAAIAAAHAQGRIISTLEGGYNLSALRRCVAAHLQALIEAPGPHLL